MSVVATGLGNAWNDAAFKYYAAFIAWLAGPPAGTTLYCALFRSDPGDAGDQSSELTGGSYARAALASAASAAKQSTTNADTAFAAASADWAPAPYMGIMSASSGGTMLTHCALPSSVTVLNGKTLKFLAGTIFFKHN